jgi:hypothetical protein
MRTGEVDHLISLLRRAAAALGKRDHGLRDEINATVGAWDSRRKRGRPRGTGDARALKIATDVEELRARRVVGATATVANRYGIDPGTVQRHWRTLAPVLLDWMFDARMSPPVPLDAAVREALQ